MRARRASCLKKRQLRLVPRAHLERLLQTSEEGLEAINAVIEGGADHPHLVTERCVWVHNIELLREHLARLPA